MIAVQWCLGGEMTLHFSRVVSPLEDMEIWSATSDGFSFVISHESRSGPGFHGRPGFVASPFKTFAEAEEACKAMLGHLTRKL
jgi:hypothetical protein